MGPAAKPMAIRPAAPRAAAPPRATRVPVAAFAGAGSSRSPSTKGRTAPAALSANSARAIPASCFSRSKLPFSWSVAVTASSMAPVYSASAKASRARWAFSAFSPVRFSFSPVSSRTAPYWARRSGVMFANFSSCFAALSSTPKPA